MPMDIDEIRRINLKNLEIEQGPELYKKAGMSPTQFYNLRDGAKDSQTGKPRGMRKETAWKLEEAAGKPKGYLDQLHEDSPVNPAGSVPLLTWEQAKNWKESIDSLPAIHPKVLVTCEVNKYTYGLRIVDDFNANSFSIGSEIVIDPLGVPANQKWIIVDDGGDQACLKKLVVSGIQKYLSCDNDRYPVLELKSTDVICGTVKQLIKTM